MRNTLINQSDERITFIHAEDTMPGRMKLNKNKITINESGEIVIPDIVCMTVPEIARFFGVYTQTINAHVRTILKSGAVGVDFSKTISIEENLIINPTLIYSYFVSLVYGKGRFQKS